MDRMLFAPEQFEQYIGCKVKVRLKQLVENRRKLQGELVTANSSEITVSADGELFKLPFSMIDRANLVAEF